MYSYYKKWRKGVTPKGKPFQKRNKIPEIPNLDDYPEILNAARAGNLVVFVGAGVSAIKGYYLWGQYAKKKIEVMNHLEIIPDEGEKVL